MTDFKLFGTIVNVIAVIVGSLIGLLIMRLTHKKGRNIEKTQRVTDSLLKALGLCAILIGLGGAIEGSVNGRIIDALEGNKEIAFGDIATERTLVIIISMALGTLIGELINLDKWVNKLGDKIQSATGGKFGNVAQGFVTASLLLCVGSLTIVGSLNSGIKGDHTLQLTKAAMDFVSVIALASTMGIGVMFSAAFVLVYQGTLTLLAGSIAGFLSTDVVTCMTAVGSLVIIGLGLNIVCDAKLRTTNFLPAIFLPIALVPLYDLIIGLFA